MVEHIGGDARIIYARVSPANQVSVKRDLRIAELLVGERQEFEHADAPGKRLLDVVHEQKVLRAGQYILAGPSALVGGDLNHAEQLRCILGFVDDQMIGAPADKADGVIECGATDFWVLEVEIFIFRKDSLDES